MWGGNWGGGRVLLFGNSALRSRLYGREMGESALPSRNQNVSEENVFRMETTIMLSVSFFRGKPQTAQDEGVQYPLLPIPTRALCPFRADPKPPLSKHASDGKPPRFPPSLPPSQQVSSVLLRQNPHNVNEWQKRVKLFADDPRKAIICYTEVKHTRSSVVVACACARACVSGVFGVQAFFRRGVVATRGL